MAGLYVHFPFCVKKCLYCDFASFAGREGDIPAYIAAAEREALLLSRDYEGLCFDTLYFGGGTPSIMQGREFAWLMGALRRYFAIDANAEITLEANPGTLCAQKLAAYREAGANRLSLGVQSLNPALLKTLGRIHTPRDFFDSVDMARQAGFDNISADLMTGLPGQTTLDVAEAVRAAVGVGACHLSVYALQVEKGTPFYDMELSLPNEDGERELAHAAVKELEALGFSRYETSNFARLGRECRHNLGYWTQRDYLGLGVAAHSYRQTAGGALRRSQSAGLSAYINGEYAYNSEQIDLRGMELEYIMLRLRLKSGISFGDYERRFSRPFAKIYARALKKCESFGLITLDGEGVYPTIKGFDLQNTLICAFLADQDGAT